MNKAQVRTLEQVRQVLAGTHALEFQATADDAGRHGWVEAVLRRFDCPRLARSDRGAILAYLQRLSGYSRAQITRLVSRWDGGKPLAKNYAAPKHAFARRYRPADVALLVDVDRAMGTLSGPATACVLRRQRDVFGDERYTRLGSMSVGHLNMGLHCWPRFKLAWWYIKRRIGPRTKPPAPAAAQCSRTGTVGPSSCARYSGRSCSPACGGWPADVNSSTARHAGAGVAPVQVGRAPSISPSHRLEIDALRRSSIEASLLLSPESLDGLHPPALLGRHVDRSGGQRCVPQVLLRNLDGHAAGDRMAGV